MIQNLSRQVKCSEMKGDKSSTARVARIIKNAKVFIHIPTNTKAVTHQITKQINGIGVSKSNEKTK